MGEGMVECVKYIQHCRGARKAGRQGCTLSLGIAKDCLEQIYTWGGFSVETLAPFLSSLSPLPPILLSLSSSALLSLPSLCLHKTTVHCFHTTATISQ